MGWKDFRNFLFAGLDFMIDENGEPVFLEANCLPGISFDFKKVTGILPYRTLSKEVFEKFTNVCLLHDDLFDDHKQLDAFLKELSRQGRINYHYCPAKKQRGENFPFFIDNKGKKIKPHCIFEASIFDYFLLKYELAGTVVINSLATKSICFDKWLTYKIVEKLKGVRYPVTFKINNIDEIKGYLSSEMFREWVLKPQFGRQGKGIIFIKDRLPKSFNMLYKRHEPYLIQERIYPKKYNKNYWDIRAFIVAGKFIGGYKRVSKKKMTNLHSGGHMEKLEREFSDSIEKPCIRVTKAISREAEKIKNIKLLHRVVEETQRVLRGNRR